MTCWQIQGGGSGDRDFSVGGRDRIRTCLSSCHNLLRSGSLCVGATDLAGLGSRWDTFERAGLGLRRGLKRGRGDGGGASVAGADDLERAGLDSRPRVDNFGRERVTVSTRGRLDKRLTIPGFGLSALERLASLLAPASESSVSVSALAFRRGYAFLVAFSANTPVSFGVAMGGPLVMVGRRKYRARLVMVNDRPSSAILQLDHSRYLLEVTLRFVGLAPLFQCSCYPSSLADLDFDESRTYKERL